MGIIQFVEGAPSNKLERSKMSLQVWIPHTTNDDLRQVGLKSFEVRNNSDFLEFNPNLNSLYGGEWSIKFNCSLINAEDNDMLLFNHTIIFLVVEDFDNDNNDYNLKIGFKDGRSHYFITTPLVENNSVLLTKHFEENSGNTEEIFDIYINNEWKSSATWLTEYPFVETAQLHSSISDFRIYDHCLSKMEIAQLANSSSIQDPIYIDKKGNIFTSAQFYEF